MPTTWAEPSFADLAAPKAEHYDVIAAKQGDAGARYRVMQRRLFDPRAHERTLRELANALCERWAQRFGESAITHAVRVRAERAAWFALIDDELLHVDVE